uniref:Sulfotransferase n=1 Tax=Nothoprocta perdicaria TaxID=30464 RepID=A0A8C6ZGS3_NOTPE
MATQEKRVSLYFLVAGYPFARDTMEPSKEYLFNHKGCYFAALYTSLEQGKKEMKNKQGPNKIFSFSGTVWTQNILSLVIYEGHRNGTEDVENMDRIPWLEYNIKNMDYAALPAPRVFATHLPYYLTPRDLRNKRVIYVTRNPKDVVVSYFHFSKIMYTLEEVSDFNLFLERFLAGKVLGGSWVDHVTGWYSHAQDFNILFLTYEEMKKDLRSVVLKICNFLGKQLSEEEVESVVRQATFENMKKDPRANYEKIDREGTYQIQHQVANKNFQQV